MTKHFLGRAINLYINVLETLPGLDGKVVNAGSESIERWYFQLRLRNREMNNT